MKRTCKECKTKHGPFGAYLHLWKTHRKDPDFQKSQRWLLRDIYDREIYTMWKATLFPFYWFGLILIAVFHPVLELLKVAESWYKKRKEDNSEQDKLSH